MGRKPNPLILQFFERGAKLNDNSNRYHHRCKSCGEDFPKGRIDSLTTHLTKKCPAISQADRINACLSLHGIHGGPNRPRLDGYSGLLEPDASIGSLPTSGPVPSLDQSHNQIWTPLETLAEVSRQIEANEKHDDHAPTTQDHTTEAITSLASAPPSFELNELSAEERLRRALLQHQEQEQHEDSPSQSALSVAAAATARLNTSLLDPQLLTEEPMPESIPQHQSTEMMIEYPQISMPETQQAQQSQQSPQAPLPTASELNKPWAGMSMTYLPIHAPAAVNDHGQQMIATPNKGGVRMDYLNGNRQRNSRARFDLNRRKEVQEVRRIGACIRCRILRKTCSKGTPCETCQKVLSPRVWRTGCVRTKLCDYINLYSAGVQAVMAQTRINTYKKTHHLKNTGVLVEVSHFPETGHRASFQVLQGTTKEAESSSFNPVILLDYNMEDIPAKVESYMRGTLEELIDREPSHHVRVTLEVAVAVANNTNDELLMRSLELWGIVEMMDRERQWTMFVKTPQDDVENYWIKDDTDSEAYTNICMQLTAAAERKASAASKNLLKGIQQNLQDGKVKLGFPMFLTVILFLNCMEKTTWAFKAWDEENLRPKWPLEKPPSSFTNQGQELMELLKMLLAIRHVLPRTLAADPETPIMADENDPTVYNYFQQLNVTPNYLRMRHQQNHYQPTDSRSLEFLFCAPLLFGD
ncbi:hypothetical protein F4819DRAFT_471424 [Hypoxylon fuscum]|nr:hypothetical protein F4819DRAFT_471424 [Hypoxylon fuscum]